MYLVWCGVQMWNCFDDLCFFIFDGNDVFVVKDLFICCDFFNIQNLCCDCVMLGEFFFNFLKCVYSDEFIDCIEDFGYML